jgi:CheY-like chemotaxis protein
MSQQPRILVVDPDDDTRTMLATALRLADCDVVEARDGRDALTRALSRPPSLVLTETALPFLDGYALCRILRTDSTTRLVPILVLTTEARPSELDRVRDDGADVVLLKPIPVDDVLAHVKRLTTPGSRHEQPTTSQTQARGHRPFATTAPPTSPPELRCPACDRILDYARSHVGGVSRTHHEQWDTFICARCRTVFEYRHRNRRLRSTPSRRPLATTSPKLEKP